MLLMTTLTLGGREKLGIFARLPDQTAQQLNEKAEALLNIDAQKRMQFVVKEMKQALSLKGLRGVERVDPSWLLGGMHGESPRTVAAILVSMPPAVVRSILKRLPSGVRKNLPPKEELKHAPTELVAAVRQIYESRFHAMPTTSRRAFGFREVIHLERKEIYQLLRDQGLEQLGQAFLAVGKLALAELCRRLPRKKAEELILAVRRTAKTDVPDLKSAQRFLSKAVVNFDDSEEFFQKAGLWRLAKAASLDGEDFCAAFRQRMPRESGELFSSYLEKFREIEEVDEDGLRRLQDTVVKRVKALADAGTIGARWGQLKLDLHYPDAEEGANSEPPAANAPVEPD